MVNIEQYGARGNNVSRHGARSLRVLDETTDLSIATINSQAEQSAAQLDATAWLGQRAMQGVAIVSQVEYQLGQAVPLAVTRLQAIGDLTALAMGQIIASSASQRRPRH